MAAKTAAKAAEQIRLIYNRKLKRAAEVTNAFEVVADCFQQETADDATLAELQRRGFLTRDFSAHQFGPIKRADLVLHEMTRLNIPSSRVLSMAGDILPLEDRQRLNLRNMTAEDPETREAEKAAEQEQWEADQARLVDTARVANCIVYLRGMLDSDGVEQDKMVDELLIQAPASELDFKRSLLTRELIVKTLTDHGYIDPNLTYR